ncbi:unnamed protein product, partial [Symbiodinium sp. CCMP2456]
MANAGKTADEIERRAARSASQLAVLLPHLLCAQFVVKYGALTYCEAMQEFYRMLRGEPLDARLAHIEARQAKDIAT